jgi:ABC-type branched-subunit amino acid transport system ATPase component
MSWPSRPLKRAVGWSPRVSIVSGAPDVDVALTSASNGAADVVVLVAASTVAIAHALLPRPKIASARRGDVAARLNEAALRNTVAEVARTTTVLVVAHRLSTVTMADRIVVMDAGNVRAIGSHAQLVARDPLYAELAATHFLATAC